MAAETVDETSRYVAALALSGMTAKQHAAKLGYKGDRIIWYALRGYTGKALRKKLIAWADKVLAQHAKPPIRKQENKLVYRRAA